MAKTSFKGDTTANRLLAGGKQPNDKPTSAAGESDQADAEQTAEKKRAGRTKTKTEETRNVNVAIPVSVLAKIYIAKQCYGNNLTQYINKVIERDLDANYEKYCNIVNDLNTFNN